MRHLFGKYFRRLKGDEAGNASVEFVIIVPTFIMLMTMSIELGFVTIRHTMLERGLDIAVRQIRLGTGEPSTYEEIKEVICDNAPILANCETELRLEMQPVDLRAYSSLDAKPKCIENSQPVEPAVLKKEFVFGGVNELMVLRACFLYDPIFPDEMMGRALQKDDYGKTAIVTMSAFVQEPS
ncbi:TadE/TadG family type IV pilus assembly protein [uncultured Roseovarius sp.]|uniref:TadE/TadG family type IV pilus assembly protein n=1 Tax=uncultured Roseovarius sp. TaxID=293344 RepID=UPI00262BFF37|nr:TadE/TadG family type IV pilus assembly protein [uncultured Roseovarius sp.]